MGDLEHVRHQVVRHDPVHLGLILPDERSHALDDCTRTPVVRNDVIGNGADLHPVEVVASHHALRRPGVRENRRQRLVQLVRQCPRELAEQGHPAKVRELVPLHRDLVLSALTLRDVANHHDDTRLAADFDGLGREARAQGAAVLVPQVDLLLTHVAPRPHELGDPFLIVLGRIHLELIDRVPDGLVACVAERGLPAIVQLDDAEPRLARDADGVEARAERLREPLLRRPQVRLDPPAYVDLSSQRLVGTQKLQRSFRDPVLELGAQRSQMPFVLPQRFFRLLVIVDVRRRAVPANDRPGRVAHRNHTDQVPPVCARLDTPDSELVLVRPVRRHGIGPRVQSCDAVDRVDGIDPRVVIDRHRRPARELVPPPIEVLDGTVRPRREDDLRHGIRQCTQSCLALTQRRLVLQGNLGRLPVGDVGVDAQHAYRTPCGIPHHGPFARQPANRPILPDRPEFDLVRCVLINGLGERGFDGRPVLRRHGLEKSAPVADPVASAVPTEKRMHVLRPRHPVPCDVPIPRCHLPGA